jgi:hypothetical protein
VSLTGAHPVSIIEISDTDCVLGVDDTLEEVEVGLGSWLFFSATCLDCPRVELAAKRD